MYEAKMERVLGEMPKNFGSANQAQPEQQKPVPAALDDLAATINGLGAITDNFVSMISPVLRPATPIPTGPGAAGQTINPPRCDVALSIADQCDRIKSICSHLQSAMSRIEV